MRYKFLSVLDISIKLNIDVDQIHSIISILNIQPKVDFKNYSYRNHIYNEDDLEGINSFIHLNKNTFMRNKPLPRITFEINEDKTCTLIIDSKMNNNQSL